MNNQWRKTKCASSSCVEVRRSGPYVEVRNSNDPQGPSVYLPVGEWNELLTQVRDGVLPDCVQERGDAGVAFVHINTVLFDSQEWGEFVEGVNSGSMFDLDEKVTADA